MRRVSLPGVRVVLAAPHLDLAGVPSASLGVPVRVALGYRVRSREGFSLAYLCDHEPTIETEAIEVSMLKDASVAIVDAHFPDRAQHAFGHGSQEHAAALARRFPKTLILAGHHGPTASDAAIRRAHRQHGKSAQNFAIAAEGMRLRWNVRRGLSVARS